ncbi:MAG: metal-dependent transcriptional regulator [Eubacterium sp.]|nr:metal-dependent transcriptional regulator [Eubacterium sp.]
MKSNESAEDYLETILLLSQQLPVVRSVDVANELGFKKSSVSVAMKKLRESEHITMTDAGYIYLTDEGKALAEKVYERHNVFTTFLTSLGVDAKVAENDACRIEHVISEESFRAFKRYIEKNNA